MLCGKIVIFQCYAAIEDNLLQRFFRLKLYNIIQSNVCLLLSINLKDKVNYS
jgi:hypothetical protein